MKPTRRLRRFFSSQPLQGEGRRVTLSESETNHLQKILRLEVGAHCLVTDGDGREAEAEISEISPNGKKATLKIIQMSRNASKAKTSSVPLRLCQALLKKGKMDFMVEKAQEFGVDEIWPVETERTEIKMTADNKTHVLDRWNRIAHEAAKQSGSTRLVKVVFPLPLAKIMEKIPADDKITVFHPGNESRTFKGWLEELESEKKYREGMPLNLFFGPEGGFSNKDLAIMRSSHEMSLVGLGNQILKADTAFLAVTAALRLVLS